MNLRGNGTIRDRSAFTAGLRRMFPAPFGWHAKYMLAAYLRDTFLVISVVLVVALSIDLAGYLGSVLTRVTDEGILGSSLFLGWYIAMRSVDKAAEFLPFAIFFGVYLAEIRQTMSRERLIVLITGRAPLQCLAPLIWFAMLVGVLEIILVFYLRPAVVTMQTAAHLGEYGEKFDRSLTSKRKWLVAGDDIVQAKINFSSPPALLDVRLFRMDSEHHLREIIDAKSATPTNDAGLWLFRDGQRMTAEPGPASSATESPGPKERAQVSNGPSFARQSMALEIDPLWLSYSGIPAKFLPVGIFRALGDVRFQPDSEYRTWAQARFSIPLAAAGMSLLAGSLCLMLLANELRLPVLLFIGICGFAAHVLTTLFVLLGEHGWVHPALAGWLVPVLILACPFAVHQLTKTRSRAGKL
jgi:lipopolysaccharide export LptBFGC system permease protein LptF